MEAAHSTRLLQLREPQGWEGPRRSRNRAGPHSSGCKTVRMLLQCNTMSGATIRPDCFARFFPELQILAKIYYVRFKPRSRMIAGGREGSIHPFPAS